MKKIRRLEKSTPPPVVAVVTNISCANSIFNGETNVFLWYIVRAKFASVLFKMLFVCLLRELDLFYNRNGKFLSPLRSYRKESEGQKGWEGQCCCTWLTWLICFRYVACVSGESGDLVSFSNLAHLVNFEKLMILENLENFAILVNCI